MPRRDGKPAVKLGLGQAGGTFTATGDVFADPLFSPDMRRTLGGSRIAVDASGRMADSRLTGSWRWRHRRSAESGGRGGSGQGALCQGEAGAAGRPQSDAGR
jgi:hypothetical protein